MQDYFGCKQISCLKNPTENEFYSAFNETREPLKIEGLMSDWKATHLWTYDYISKNIGHKEVIVSNQETRPHRYYTSTLSKMIDLVLNDRSLRQYCHLVHHRHCRMKNDYSVPKYFDCWYKQLPASEQKLNLSWIYLGTRYSYSPLHVDIYNTSAWNAVFIGKKLWLFFSPDQAKFLYGGQVDPLNPDYLKYPDFKKAKPLICVQDRNEIVYTPSGWWHSVINLEAGFALTENFINELNVEHVRKDLISIGAKKAVDKLATLARVHGRTYKSSQAG